MKLTTILGLFVAACLLLAVGFVAGRLTARNDVTTAAEIPVTVLSVPVENTSVPVFEVPGNDIPSLPPYAGATRVEFRQVIVNDLLETEVEYVVSGELRPIHDFYRDVFETEGWLVADLGIHQGEWTFFVIRGEQEALVELEARGSLVEIEIELTEPVPAGLSPEDLPRP